MYSIKVNYFECYYFYYYSFNKVYILEIKVVYFTTYTTILHDNTVPISDIDKGNLLIHFVANYKSHIKNNEISISCKLFMWNSQQ